MKIFTTKTINVFNPELVGNAVSLTVGGQPRNVIITSVQDDSITIAGVTGVKVCTMKHFESGEMSMELLYTKPDPVTVVEKNDTIYVAAAEPIEKPDGRKGRTYSVPFIKRTKEQVQADNEVLVEVLTAHGKPMQLQKIVRQMNRKGRRHWNTNNATSFIKLAIREGRGIQHLDRGIYAIELTGGIGQ